MVGVPVYAKFWLSFDMPVQVGYLSLYNYIYCLEAQPHKGYSKADCVCVPAVTAQCDEN